VDTTGLAANGRFCPETTNARNPSTQHISPGLGFSSGRSREGLQSRAVGRQAFPGGPIARVQSHKVAIGSAEEISAAT
jgi:hypothetical protein